MAKKLRELTTEELRHAKKTMPPRTDRGAFLVWSLRWAEDALSAALTCRGRRGERA